jgi:hypothetical protein
MPKRPIARRSMIHERNDRPTLVQIGNIAAFLGSRY